MLARLGVKLRKAMFGSLLRKSVFHRRPDQGVAAKLCRCGQHRGHQRLPLAIRPLTLTDDMAETAERRTVNRYYTK